jgi:hypothetical protein
VTSGGSYSLTVPSNGQIVVNWNPQ